MSSRRSGGEAKERWGKVLPDIDGGTGRASGEDNPRLPPLGPDGPVGAHVPAAGAGTPDARHGQKKRTFAANSAAGARMTAR
ncbi:hypothetical protein GCM10011354_31150 [Egicoccus halophilus]|uniref:Uncharacterized protein n=1 Tax=Egicoccus halophilus TaxID=1670830 RepID=A0A8J3AAS1_9ACTN|nr:hypothetical protein GCM10011354_31150 [Egicoccus halophilus]